MNVPRRRFLHLAAAAAALRLALRTARAQAPAYPTRLVRIIVPFPPAGLGDLVARLLGQWLTERLGQSFVIENRPGAGSNIGTEAAVNAAPDGYTLLVVGSPNVINAALYDKLNFNFLRDIAPVAGAIRLSNVVEINPSVPATTLPQFIAYAKANPGKINMASNGTGTVPHLAGELFKMMAGVNLVHVPYRGAGPALTDLIGGQVQVSFDNTASSIEHIRAGRLRALAVTAATRIPLLPDLPPVGEFVPGYEATTWTGIGAPRRTPAEIIDKLNREINAALADPEMRGRLADLGGTVLLGTPAEFGKLMADDAEKWAKVVKFAGVKAD